MANGNLSNLPPGFVLDQPSQELPPGFVIDEPEVQPVAQPPITGRGRGAQTAIRGREQALETLRQENPALAAEIESLSGPEAFLIGAGRGFTTLGRGIQRLFGADLQLDPAEEAGIRALEEVRPIAQAGEITAEAAPFLIPGGAIGQISSMPVRIAASGALGATEGGLISAGTNRKAEDIAKSAAIGFGLGAGGEVLLPVINRLGRKIMQKFGVKGNVITPEGTPTPELEEALNQQGASVDDLVNAANEQAVGDIVGNAQREEAFRRLGLEPTEAQRTRDVDLFVDQQDAFRKSGRVRQALDLQEAQLTEKTAEAISDIGASGPPSSAIDAVVDRSLRLDEEIGQLYNEARRRAPQDAIVRPADAVKTLQTNASKKAVQGGVFESLRDEMRAQGLLSKDKFIPQARMTVQQSEELRQFANSLFPGSTPQGKQLIRDFKASLDNDVFKASGDDIFESARKAKRNFELGLTKEAKNKFDKNRVSLIRDMLENKIAPEDIGKVLNAGSKYKAADLADLKRYLSEGTPEDVARGLESWNDIRGSALERIRDTAFIGPVRADGSKSLSRAGLEKAFKNIGNEKLGILFSSEERKFLRDLAQVAALKEPPPGTFTGTGPTGLAVERGITRLLGRLSSSPGSDMAADVLGGFRDRRLTRKQEQRVLDLLDDAEKIREQNSRTAFEALRKSQLGDAATAIPLIAIPAIQEEQ